MAIQNKLISLLFLHIVLGLLALDSANAQGLKVGYYQKTCPSAEKIVKETTYDHISRAPTLAAALLRMHFHDCFVRVTFSLSLSLFGKVIVRKHFV